VQSAIVPIIAAGGGPPSHIESAMYFRSSSDRASQFSGPQWIPPKLFAATRSTFSTVWAVLVDENPRVLQEVPSRQLDHLVFRSMSMRVWTRNCSTCM
jgi:hypothetical protein